MTHSAQIDLLRRLNSSDDAVRNEAIAGAKSLSMRELLDLALVLRRHISATATLNSIGGLMPVFFAFAAVLWLARLFKRDSLRRQPETAVRSLSQLITECADPLALNTLLSLHMRSSSPDNYLLMDVRPACVASLTTAMSTLDRIGYQRLDGGEKYRLAGLLAAPYDHVELTLVVLRLLGEYADPRSGSSRFYITHLSREPAITSNMTRVSEAAKAALRRMNERSAMEEASRTLVRGSSVPNQSETLVRAAAQTPNTTPPEQLLRAESATDTQRRYEVQADSEVHVIEQGLGDARREQ